MISFSEMTKTIIYEIIFMLICCIFSFALTIALLVWTVVQNNIMSIMVAVIGNCVMFIFLIFFIVLLVSVIKEYKKEKEIEND